MLLAPFALDTLAMMLSAQAEKMARGGECRSRRNLAAQGPIISKLAPAG